MTSCVSVSTVINTVTVNTIINSIIMFIIIEFELMVGATLVLNTIANEN